VTTGADRLVWLSTLRKGIAWHEVSRRHHTDCGRFVGIVDGEPLRGELLPLDEAERRFFVVPCKRCTGTAEVVAPRAGRRG
jgi:hypothetical protein